MNKTFIFLIPIDYLPELWYNETAHTSCGERVDPQIAADAVRKIGLEYDTETVMTFGGEPLLYLKSLGVEEI